VLVAAAVLVVTAVTLFAVSLRDLGYAHVRIAPGAAAAQRHRDAATVVVEAAPFSTVELRVNGRHVASAYVPWNAREVRFEGTPIDDGRNEIVAQATLWYAAVPRSHEAALAVDNPPAPGPAGRRATHSRISAAARNGRSLALQIRQQEVDAAFAVMLPRSDPAVVRLLHGRGELPAFVDDVFGAPRFNRKPMSRFFTGVLPRLYAAGDGITVSADSGYQRPGLADLPPFAGDVEIGNAFTGPRVRVGAAPDRRGSADPRAWGRDVLRVRVDDYRVAIRGPAPASGQGAAYVWNRPFDDRRAPVTLSLTYTPLASAGALRRGLNLPVFAFTYHILARFLAFAHGFVLGVPMFVYLVLSRGRNARFAAIARRLIALAVGADVFTACISAQPDADRELVEIVPALRAIAAPQMIQIVVPAVVGLVLALIAGSAAKLAERWPSPAGILVFAAANGVKLAALGYAAAAVAGSIVTALPRASLAYPLAIDAVLAAALLLVLRFTGWWDVLAPRTWRRAFTAATIVFAVVITMPSSLVHFGSWAISAHDAGTAFADPTSPLALAAEFLRPLGPLAPVAFGAMLIAAGRRAGIEALGVRREQFARLALCCYAVDAYAVVVLVPVSFVLAWLTFRWIRAPHREDGAASGDPWPARTYATLLVALAFALASFAMLLPYELQYLREAHTPFMALEAIGFVATLAMSFAVPAFAFGACYDELAGSSAVRKGLIVAVWAVACSFPAWFVRLDSALAIVSVAVVTALFYFALGIFSGATFVRARRAVPTASVPRPALRPE